MLQRCFLYFIPSKGEFIKIQPGTGDNLSPEDIEAGFTDYVIWNRFVPGPLDIDGELEMECIDSGMLLIKETPGQARGDMNKDGMTKAASIASASPRNDTQSASNDIIRDVLEQAYGERNIEIFLLFEE